MWPSGTNRSFSYFFNRPRAILAALLAVLFFLGGGFALFGGHRALLNPLDGLTLNVTITGLILLYLSLLALLPFSWIRSRGGAGMARMQGSLMGNLALDLGRPRIILAALLATLLFLFGILAYFGGYQKMMEPAKEVGLNVLISGLILLYLSLLALLPFSWIRSRGGAGMARMQGSLMGNLALDLGRPRIILAALLATLLFLFGILAYFGGYQKMMEPAKQVGLNVLISGLILLYLGLLARLPFSWKGINDSVDDKPGK